MGRGIQRGFLLFLLLLFQKEELQLALTRRFKPNEQATQKKRQKKKERKNTRKSLSMRTRRDVEADHRQAGDDDGLHQLLRTCRYPIPINFIYNSIYFNGFSIYFPISI